MKIQRCLSLFLLTYLTLSGTVVRAAPSPTSFKKRKYQNRAKKRKPKSHLSIKQIIAIGAIIIAVIVVVAIIIHSNLEKNVEQKNVEQKNVEQKNVEQKNVEQTIFTIINLGKNIKQANIFEFICGKGFIPENKIRLDLDQERLNTMLEVKDRKRGENGYEAFKKTLSAGDPILILRLSKKDIVKDWKILIGEIITKYGKNRVYAYPSLKTFEEELALLKITK